jgi:hypothetical protein
MPVCMAGLKQGICTWVSALKYTDCRGFVTPNGRYQRLLPEGTLNTSDRECVMQAGTCAGLLAASAFPLS